MIVIRVKVCKFYLLSLFFISFGIAKAQQVELSEYYNQLTEEKELSFNEKEQLLDSLLHLNNIEIDTLELVKIYREFFTETDGTNIKRRLLYTEKIEELAVQLNVFDTDNFKKNHRNRIYYLGRNQEYYKGLKSALDYLKRYPETNSSLGKVYRQLGNIYGELGDLQKAIDNFDKSIYIYKEVQDNKGLATSLKDKLATYVNLEDSAYNLKIRALIEEMEALKKDYDFTPKIEKSYVNSLGYFFDFLGDYSKAKNYYFEALNISIQEEDFENTFFMYLNLGVLSKKENDLQKALQYFQKALEYTYEDKNKEAMVFNNLGDICQIETNHKKALIYYQNAITQALQIETLNPQTLPNFQDIELSPNKLDVLGYLIDKANGWLAYYEAENYNEYLQYALETFTLADRLIDIIYVESREDLSKLFWRKKGATFYPKAVEVCYRLQQPEKAFFFMEKNKAMLLLENMTNATAKRLSKLPENILNREQNLIKQIKTLESEIQGNATVKTKRTDSLKNTIFIYKTAYNAFIDSLETSYPKYYNYKTNIQIVTLKKVQKSLQKDALVLQYIVGTEKGFVALISSDEVQLQELPPTEILSKTVTTYKNAVSKPFVNKNDKQTYQEVATKLYKQLLPFENAAHFSQKRITIIADGMLQYIPFEALRMPNNEYLIQNAEIHYNYSLSSAAQSKQNKTPISETFIAIAPTKFKNNQFATLTTSSTELQKLTNIFDADHFQYENATKERFTTAYGNYKIVHLSTHGGIDNTVPWMAFYDEKITLDELYFTKNQSDLVVLSACKTSDGELKKGEGVMSLARGFFNAGAKSVVSSLWDINEKASNEIIQEFYKNIVAGDTKSAALQKAKLSYIQKNKNTSEVSPYYWSALTLTGDANPISVSQNSNLYYILGGIGLFGIVIFLRRKQTTTKAS
ncbi:photosystem I assembly protein Ycf3 [Kordia sp. SMS9]|uniref:CHAT domain-containing protein n=1 Tax=Kordia sp. SMS9 TaxID=2282170 RepID=UPI000E0DD0E6|nr:CHAT domain-containing tetratricopeptide repeat protein [Kordia sp. SMS9]AXG68586.1 photosystem I assembly protein Ycf3 [Kordia sp. SMS9]